MFVERLEQHFVLSKHINVSWYVLIFFISMIRIPSPLISFFFFPETSPLIYLFIYGCVGSLLRGLSLVAVSGGYASLRCAGFSLQWLLLLRSTSSRRVGFSGCGTWAQ